MPAYDVQLEALGESHWITVYYGPATKPEEERKLCGYYCPTLLPGGAHHCKVFGTYLETLEKPNDSGSTIVIAKRCDECLSATQKKRQKGTT